MISDETSSTSPLDQANELAEAALAQARSTLMTQFPFLDVALWKLPLVPDPTLRRALGTDGYRLLFNAPPLIASYRANPNDVLRDYLHTVLHCVFRHPFDAQHPKRDLWDAACDAAVEATALELAGLSFPCTRDDARRRALDQLRKACPQLTAQALYKLLNQEDNGISRCLADALPDLFARDDHVPWPRTDATAETRKRLRERALMLDSDGTERLSSPPEDVNPDDEDDQRHDGVNNPGAPAPSSSTTAVEGEVENGDSFINLEAREEAEATFESMDNVGLPEFDDISWQDISAQIQLDMEAFTGKIGVDAGTFMVNLHVANRKRYDYREFLKRFAALSEEMKVSPDEFDYIYYTYGLTRYKNMPLIEPLEYQETNRIRDFVIAIDTSASCAGHLVQRFAEKTYDVLKNSEGFGHKVNIHVIQCDCEVRRDVKITSIRDFENAFEEFNTRGFGGTDFRPVFAYVDELIRTRELANLKGLIYFTDGLGKFPAEPPDYEVAFVFVDDTPRERKVPPWAMKVVMDEDDIVEL